VVRFADAAFPLPPRRNPPRGPTATEGGSGGTDPAADATGRPVEAAWTGRLHDSERSCVNVSGGLMPG